MADRNNNIVQVFFSTMHKVYLESKSYTRRKLKEEGFDMTPEMIQALYFLWKKEGMNQQELANVLHKDKASMTNLIDNLSKRGLVIRKEAVEDRRNKIITITSEGMRLKKIIQPQIDEVFAVAGKDIPVPQMKAALAILKAMLVNLSSAGQ